jgi:flavin-dependent dehydrogenase
VGVVDADVIISGAGVAGSTAAVDLAPRRVPLLLIDIGRSRFPRPALP